MTPSCESDNLGATGHSYGSWADSQACSPETTPTEEWQSPNSQLPPFPWSWHRQTCPEPRRFLIQEKSPRASPSQQGPWRGTQPFPQLQTPPVSSSSPASLLLPWLSLGTKTFEQIHRNMLIDRQARFLLPWGGHRLVEHCRGKSRNEQRSNSPGSCILMYSDMSPQGVCRPSGIQGVWAKTISLNCWSRHPNRILDLKLPYGDWLTPVPGLTKTPL